MHAQVVGVTTVPDWPLPFISHTRHGVTGGGGGEAGKDRLGTSPWVRPEEGMSAFKSYHNIVNYILAAI